MRYVKLIAVNVWSGFGLRASPFFNQPLEPDEDHPTRPITLFVGREAESQLVLNKVAGSHSSASMVTGGFGVGKTTFIHYVQHRLRQDPSVLIHPSPVRMTSTMTPEAITAEVLRRLLGGVELAEGLDRVTSSPAFKRAEEAVRRVDRWSGSVSILGLGGGVEKATVEPPFPVHDLVSLAFELAERIQDIDADRKNVIHLKNLENVYDPSEPQRAQRLFMDIRDLLQLDGVHYLMAGSLGLYRSAIHKEQKVSDVVGLPIILSPLDRENAWKAIGLRAAHLSRNGERGKVPITQGAFSGLYQAFGGNLRGVFSLAEQIFEGRPPKEFEPLDWNALAPTAREMAVAHLGGLLGRSDLGYLKTAYERFKDREFRQADLAPHLDMKQPSVSRAMDRWAGERLIEVVREEPPARYVRLSGLVLIAFGWDPGK